MYSTHFDCFIRFNGYHSLKKSSFLKSMLLLNFRIWWSLNLKKLKIIIRWYSKGPYLNRYYFIIFSWCYYLVSKRWVGTYLTLVITDIHLVVVSLNFKLYPNSLVQNYSEFHFLLFLKKLFGLAENSQKANQGLILLTVLHPWPSPIFCS